MHQSMSKILKFEDSRKTKKPEYLEIKTFFLRRKFFFHYTLRAKLCQKTYFSGHNFFFLFIL